MRFPSIKVVMALHDEQLGLFGGLQGIRDLGLLESALARGRNLEAYGEQGPYRIAAAIGFGIARNHPFADANKRTALHTTLLTLLLNGVALPPQSVDMVETMVQLAEGRLSEAAFADWLRAAAGAG